jgi:hypothetical protein
MGWKSGKLSVRDVVIQSCAIASWPHSTGRPQLGDAGDSEARDDLMMDFARVIIRSRVWCSMS